MVSEDQWTPLSDRDAPSARALKDGVPAGLETPLRGWIESTAEQYMDVIERVAVRTDVDLHPESYPYQYEGIDIVARLAYWTPTKKLLDITDALLNLAPIRSLRDQPEIASLAPWQAADTPHDLTHCIPLQQLLADAGSLYTIRADGRALVRRLGPAVVAVTDEAAKAADQPERGSATRHLRQALDAAYALHPDPVKAYSEAIKAVESAAHATLQPKHDQATLGTMLGEFRQVRAKLTVPIAGKSGAEGLAVVESMMALLWTGQTSRHGNLQETREETVQEAVMAVHLAASLVQFFASGVVQRS
ncbi:hypothetical protein [Streptomyces sp. NBC_00989]|uniref:hypothetical protein n=1 Tax=Streptomyces sp. NBC_00989 TaxID=2903705 RepID=UPI002F9147AD|nr:hypothetical protein OG714_54495 [Streptomyces sp. NBC_00989]